MTDALKSMFKELNNTNETVILSTINFTFKEEKCNVLLITNKSIYFLKSPKIRRVVKKREKIVKLNYVKCIATTEIAAVSISSTDKFVLHIPNYHDHVLQSSSAQDIIKVLKSTYYHQTQKTLLVTKKTSAQLAQQLSTKEKAIRMTQFERWQQFNKNLKNGRNVIDLSAQAIIAITVLEYWFHQFEMFQNAYQSSGSYSYSQYSGIKSNLRLENMPNDLMLLISKYCENPIIFNVYSKELVSVDVPIQKLGSALNVGSKSVQAKPRNWNDYNYNYETVIKSVHGTTKAAMVSCDIGWYQNTGVYSITLKINRCGGYNFIGVFNARNVNVVQKRNIYCKDRDFNCIYFFTSKHRKIRCRKGGNISLDWTIGHSFGQNDCVKMSLDTNTYKLSFDKNGKLLKTIKIEKKSVYYPFVGIRNETLYEYVVKGM